MTSVICLFWHWYIDPLSANISLWVVQTSGAGSVWRSGVERTVSSGRDARWYCAQHNAANQVFIRAMNPVNETRVERSAEHYIFAVGTYKLLAFTIGTIGVFGFCNNVVVLILYCRFKRLRTPTNLLLVNISLSDLLVSLIGINFTFASCVKGRWIWSQATCIWDGFSNSLFGERNTTTKTFVFTLGFISHLSVMFTKFVCFNLNSPRRIHSSYY